MRLSLFFSGLPWACALAAWPMSSWDAFREYDLFKLRPGDETHQFSSYDRNNHNDDGFEGTYSCLRTDNGNCVIAEYKGPGMISSIWFTYEPDSIRKAGNLAIVLDGETVLSGSVQDIVDGRKGAPFVFPFVTNTNSSMGGNTIKVPMPFKRSMLITTSNNPHFHHVTYRRFPSNVIPETFDPSNAAEDARARVEGYGCRDPKVPARTNNKRSTSVNHRAVSEASGNDKTRLSVSQNCGIISKMTLRLPAVKATSFVEDDGRAMGVGGGTAFKLRLDPNNTVCRLVRRLDPGISNQKLDFLIDGTYAGSFDSGTSRPGRWADEVLDIPPALTKRKRNLRITTKCHSSSLDCNEFLYALHCKATCGKWASPEYANGKKWTLMDLLNVGWNNREDEAAHDYVINQQTWEGLRQFEYDDQDHTVSPMPDARISIAFDGQETVSNVPIAAFFGAGLAKSQVRSLMLSVDTMVPDGVWTSYFPMPFTQNAEVSLTSRDGSVRGATVEAEIIPCEPGTLVDGEWGHFRVQYRRDDTTLGQLWPLLSAKGPGVAYGVTHTLRGDILRPSNTLEFLEGDEQVWLNQTAPGGINDTTATMLGTGTEDFYESGWYFQDANAPGAPVTVPFGLPFTGLTVSTYGNLGCRGSSLSVYRQMLVDSQAFGADGISFNIEHGPDGNNIPANYETCAFYYA